MCPTLLEASASNHSEAAAVPASSVPLPAFSPRASALSVPGAEAALAWPPPEACVAVGDRSVEAFAAAERVGSGSARDDWVRAAWFRADCSAVPQADDSPPADCLADSSRDDCPAVPQAGDSRPADCLADSSQDDYPAVSQEGDSSPDGCSADSSRDDYPAVPRGARSSPAAQSDDSAQAGWSADLVGYLLVVSPGDSPPAGCSADSSRDDYPAVPRGARSSPVARLGGSPPGDCSAETGSLGSAAPRADDSAARDWPRPDARLEPVDCPDGSPAGC